VTDAVRRIADAVLYEGYVLWPYRRSALKNQKRWTFGGVFPRVWHEEHPDDPWQLRTECLVEGEGARVDVRVRFLQVVRRQVLDSAGLPVDGVEADGELHLTWDEAVEREVAKPAAFAFPPDVARREAAGASIFRSWNDLEGEVAVASEPAEGGLRRLTLTISNTTRWVRGPREAALTHALCSTHAILQVANGAFVSPLDPLAADCRNEGLWPCLVGEPPDRHTLLASPIILEEYPRIAPESPGDLFDAGEIDELLILNVLALTDDERREVRASDPRARELIDRCLDLPPEHLLKLHGALRA
jgi:hypothetical protein